MKKAILGLALSRLAADLADRFHDLPGAVRATLREIAAVRVHGVLAVVADAVAALDVRARLARADEIAAAKGLTATRFTDDVEYPTEADLHNRLLVSRNASAKKLLVKAHGNAHNGVYVMVQDLGREVGFEEFLLSVAKDEEPQ